MVFEPNGIPVEQGGMLLPVPWLAGMTRSSVAFKDMNGDSVFDAYCGSQNGCIWYFPNYGTSQVPQFTFSELVIDTFFSDHTCSPSICDIDGDGDNDLFIADWDEWEAWYFDNYGGIQNPQFQFFTDSLEGISYCSNLDFKDMDSGGDFDIISGGGGGGVEYYENIGTVQNYNFVFIDSIYEVHDYSKPSLGDLDNDVDFDMVCGNDYGQIQYLFNNGDPNQLKSCM